MRILVHVKLHKHIDEVIEIQKGIYEVHTMQPPMEGKANEDVIRQLAEYFKTPKTTIEIISGETAKRKVMEIHM